MITLFFTCPYIDMKVQDTKLHKKSFKVLKLELNLNSKSQKIAEKLDSQNLIKLK